MGLYDNILLPEDFELPEFPHNPRYTNSGRDRLWQTNDLLCGQDRYRLRKFDDPESDGTHQLERRVPPIQKMTRNGNQFIRDSPESTLLFWNIVRPSEEITITDIESKTIYEYRLTIQNGVLTDVALEDIREFESLSP